MNNIFYVLIFNFLSIIVIILLLYPNTKKDINSFSAYYNSEGAFAGFIQKKENLFRACEWFPSIAVCGPHFRRGPPFRQGTSRAKKMTR